MVGDEIERQHQLSAATVRGKQVQLQTLFASQLATLVYTHGMVAHEERRGEEKSSIAAR